MKEQPCLEFAQRIGSSMASPSAGASSAESGPGLSPSAEPDNARADAPESVSTVEASGAPDSPFTLSGWHCESFAAQTGHEVGRLVQLGNLQLCLTVGEMDGSEPREVPGAVLSWLMTGEDQ